MIREIQAKSALHFHGNLTASNWDVNIYRGCGHCCIYCFARYSHSYLEDTDFFGDIFVKTNIAECLDKDFSRRSWCRDPVNFCGVTDAYQPVEEEYQLMPEVLKVFIKHRNPLVLVTKSILPLRDIRLIGELARVAQVTILASVSTLNEKISNITEPHSAHPAERLNMLARFREAGCRTGILMMPVIPYLTDSEENLREVFELAQKIGVNVIEPDILNLRGSTREPFLKVIKKEFPDIYPDLSRLYKGSNSDKTYQNKIKTLIRKLHYEYGPWPGYVPPERIDDFPKEQQLSLF